ncbi:M56 family metallopeptidase [Blastopirellula marina]|uniref:Peptidase M56 domain-containing protein n=1 Tax=Blastopirellula marina TaxID=124 RepID=A0A2S8FND2_9BACT|nr:carboxypeptidase regulatory-like domain-containing protein [Blastopirellula marina]PQO33703.1 hypothetical protein C5Y98_15840 [Blastopirellula marina]PTL43490.1 hypothetical protein C5Y97_15850 [Blastopirellula marina]
MPMIVAIVSTFGAASWLIVLAFSSLLLLTLGGIAVRCCRQPVHRICIIQWVFVACLIVPVAEHLRLLPGWNVPLLVTNSEMAEPTQVALTERQHESELGIGGISSPDSNATNSDQTTAASAESPGNKVESVSAAASPVAAMNLSENRPSDVPNGPIGTWLARLIPLIYFFFVALLATWWGLGWILRKQFQRTCHPASGNTVAILHSLAGGKSKHVQVLTSNRIESPVMWGLWRPTIVIPASLEHEKDDSHLRWALAHEWAHVQRNDIFTHYLAVVVKFACFFQPMYWWLKRELTLSQDILADAFAAQQGESEEYAAFLIAMAKDRAPVSANMGLSMADGRSSLFKRVQQLLQPSQPLVHSPRKWLSISIAATTIFVMLGLSSLHLGDMQAVAEENDIVPAAEENPSSKSSDKDARDADPQQAEAFVLPPAPDVKPITYTGTVIDELTGKPVPGAVVQIKRELSRAPGSGKWILLEMTEHKTNDQGVYEFTLTPEQVAQSSLYLEVNAHHPEYQSKGWSGYSHSMIRTNLEKGDPPFYATIKLSPGQPITGIVARPDGTPIPGVQISSYTIRALREDEARNRLTFRGAFQDAQTDEQGRFRLIVPTPGDGVLWIHPREFASEAHRLYDRRGDLGTFTLSEGKSLTGQVLDAKGQPVANVGVELRRDGDGQEADEFLDTNAVANGIRARAMTNEDGTFTLTPLPPGTYTAEIQESVSDPTLPRGNWFDRKRDKMPYVFVRQKVEILADAKTDPLLIQALPHVIIRGRFFDSQGKPRASHEQDFIGKFNDSFYFTRSSLPGSDGWFEILVPHGITESKITTMTNEHSSLRWKLPGMEKLTYGYEIPLGTLEDDFEGLEIVRYKAPILLLSVVDENGRPVKDFTVKSTYTEDPTPIAGTPVQDRRYRTGDVGFEQQADGRMRSSQLLPDAELTVEPTKDGFEAVPQAVTLKEGETQELKFVLKKNSTGD